jgi:hypothetical protein
VIVERITSLREFEHNRAAYERLYAQDGHCSVFTSWAWLRSYFAAIGPRWLVLAARDDWEHLGFCVVVRRGIEAGGVGLYREVALGAYPTADYTSLVIGSREEEVLAEFARALDAMPWDVFRACNVRDLRVRRIVKLLGERNDVTREADNPVRSIRIPEGSQRMLRLGRELRGTRFVESNDATLKRDIDTLLRFHHRRWSSNLAKARRTYGRLFREAYARGCCRVGVLWSEENRPLAAQAAFVDDVRSAWGVYMIAYDKTHARQSPGIGMLAAGLERARALGFREYDFLRGDEPYKARMGAELSYLENYTVRRRAARARIAERIWLSALAWKATLRRILFGRTL